MLRLGLIGSGIRSSRSPAMHEAAAHAHGLACSYRRFDLDESDLGIDALPGLVTAMEREGYAGFNVTHPCKQAILPLLTNVSAEASIIGAVNTVVLAHGRREGHNTDWNGFREGLLYGLPGVDHDRVVQLGAGGAGAATAYALLAMGCRHLTIVDIAGDRARHLAARLADWLGPRVTAAIEPADALRSANGLVHATPTGMSSHPGLPIDPALLRPDLWVAEVVYFPLETELLREARRQRCRSVDGSHMALYQAVEAFRLFTRLEPSVERMREAFLRAGQAA